MLQQSTSFKKFMGKLVPFFQVAGRAGNDQRIDIISSTLSTQWEGMIDMVLAPSDLAMAVVALATLSVILFSNLQSGMSAWYGLFACIAVTCVNSTTFWIALITPLVILSISITGLLAYFSNTISTSSLQPMQAARLLMEVLRGSRLNLQTSIALFAVFWNSTLDRRFRTLFSRKAINTLLASALSTVIARFSETKCVYRLYLLADRTTLDLSLLGLLQICVSYILGFAAFLALASQSIPNGMIGVEVFQCCRLQLIAFRTSLESFGNGLFYLLPSAFAPTPFTGIGKAIRVVLVFVEEIRRGGKEYPTLGTLLVGDRLEYNIVHGKNFTFFSSRLRLLQQRGGSTLFNSPQYTTNPPLKQLQEVF